MRRADARRRTPSVLRTDLSSPRPPRSRALAAVLVAAVLAACASGPGADVSPEESAGPEPVPGAPDVAEDPDLAEEPEGDGADDEAGGEVAPPPPVYTDPGEVPPTRAALQGQIGRVLDAAAAELDEGHLAVLVVDEHGREVAGVGPDEPLLPASTQKLVTAAGLLRTLGPEARLRTHVEASAPLEENGALRGDLHLLGTGDPALATDDYGRWVYPARPRTSLDELADQLVDAGLVRVRGDVVVDAEGFTGPPRAEGWRDTYFSDLDARLVSGLTVDGGLETLVTFPGDPDLEERDRDDPDDGRERARPRPRPPVDEQEDLGTPRVRVQAAQDPAVQAGVELIRLLEERGVRVDGGAVAGPRETRAVGRLASIESPPMRVLLRFMVQQSDNHLADTLWHVLGRVRTGEGSWESGARAARQVLDLLGVDHKHAAFADGSGLSREDRLTARLLVDLDRAMTAGRHAETWRALMAVAGEEGTLRTRLRGTPAQGRLLGKTGSLSDVSALSGVVDGAEGRRYHFAVIANDARGADRAVVRALVDEIGLLLSADLLACRATRDGGADDTPLGQPPVVVRC
jgi:serine-type D-Ala-D-Ala carboxypeptidase/endopeptidase (penicillin-binding protein 4)